MRMALFISLVTFVLKCKHCSYSNESSTKIIYPLVKENKRTEMSMPQSCIHAFKHIMANPSQKAGKERNSPLQCVKGRWEIDQLNQLPIHQYIFTEALGVYTVYELYFWGTKVLKDWIVLFCSHFVLQFIFPESAHRPSAALQQSVIYRSLLYSLMQSPGD